MKKKKKTLVDDLRLAVTLVENTIEKKTTGTTSKLFYCKQTLERLSNVYYRI